MSTQAKRPFPKILVTLALLALTVILVYLLAVAPDVSSVDAWFRSFGAFICAYDVELIAMLVVVNLIELIDILIFAKRDETINAIFESSVSNHIGIGKLFGQYFAGVFSRAPLIFSTEELSSAIPRLIINLITSVVKFVSWLILLITTIGMFIKPEVYDFALGEGIDYAFTVLVLLFFLNCHMFVYALYRILPFHETRTYETITYYSDGSTRSQITHHSNFIAIIFLCGVMYMFSTAYYILPLSNKIARMVETIRFRNHLNSSRYKECLRDFYG